MRALGHQTPSFFVHMLYQNTKNGQLVEFIGHHDKDWAMVKTSSGAVQYVSLEDLVSYEAGKGRTGKTVAPLQTNAITTSFALKSLRVTTLKCHMAVLRT